MDPDHDSALVDLLSRTTPLPVRPISDNLAVRPNCVHVIPPDTNLSIADGILKLQPRERSRLPHRPINAFFESLAQDCRDRAIGVVLSGTASDGTLGLGAIKSEGGITFAQDDSAKYDSMPRSAVAAGCVDFVLSPAGIAHELARIAKHPYIAGVPRAGVAGENRDAVALSGSARNLPGIPGGNSYRQVLLLLLKDAGVDFSLYKSSDRWGC